MTDLMEIDISVEQAPAIYGHNKLLGYLDAAREAVSSEVPDLSTKKGRERVASLAAKVSRSKKAVENPGREYLKQLKAKIKPVEDELREFVREMDNLRDEVRRPLTELEEREAQHAAEMQTRLDRFRVLTGAGGTADEIRMMLEEAQTSTPDESWGDLQFEGERLREMAIKHLARALDARLKFDADQEELAKLRAEAEERKRKEEAEAAIKAAEEQAKQAAAEELERAKQAARDAEERASKAAEQERKRIEAEAARVEEEQAKREANRKHCGSVNRSAAVALASEAGITPDQAKEVVKAIAKGLIPNVSINY